VTGDNLSRPVDDQQAFAAARDAINGLPVSHVWRGHGSALFLEFGTLSPTGRRGGEAGEPEGAFGLMIEWSWRIEAGMSIVCGSWSDDDVWPSALEGLEGAKVESVAVSGVLPEIVVTLSNGTRVLSFMTAEGEPAWTLFDRRGPSLTFHSKAGNVCIER
jgi:hypothetical protein